MPVLLALLLGFQHALAMLAGGGVSQVYSLQGTCTEFSNSNQSSDHYWRSRWSKSDSGPTAISCIDLPDRLWDSFCSPDYKVPCIQNALLCGYWSHICVCNSIHAKEPYDMMPCSHALSVLGPPSPSSL